MLTWTFDAPPIVVHEYSNDLIAVITEEKPTGSRLEGVVAVVVLGRFGVEKAKSSFSDDSGWEYDLSVYILLSKLNSEGRKTVRENPGRIQEVNKEIEKLGVKVLSQYATLGPYDFVNVVEAPDNKTIVRVSVELGSRGTIEITTLPTISLSEFVSTVKGK
jgi:uncharacterized protein with GYD domain